jgi:LacI family transcriptional regulator
MARKTIDDVAALAGVSIKTVSRVMNFEKGVRPETRERVEAAMAELNYQPSLPARSLAGGRSNLIGLVFENPSANYVFNVQSGAIAKCRDLGIRLFLQSCDDLGDRLIDEVLAVVDQTHVDGLVITPPVSANHDLVRALDARGVTFVRMAPDDLVHSSPVVEMDDEAAAREMTAYLLALGHRRIGFIAGHPDHYSSRLRLKGFRGELEAWGIDPDAQCIEQGVNDHASGLMAGRRMLSHSTPPTAVFAANDDMAAGAIVAAHELGIEIPDELSIAGFDDTQLAGIVWPTLTTIHQPVYDMAFAATGLLIELIKGGDVPPVTKLAYRMVRRASTAPPPG